MPHQDTIKVYSPKQSGQHVVRLYCAMLYVATPWHAGADIPFAATDCAHISALLAGRAPLGTAISCQVHLPQPCMIHVLTLTE